MSAQMSPYTKAGMRTEHRCAKATASDPSIVWKTVEERILRTDIIEAIVPMNKITNWVYLPSSYQTTHDIPETRMRAMVTVVKEPPQKSVIRRMRLTIIAT